MSAVRNERGQAVIESILITAIIVSAFVVVSQGLTKMGLTRLMMKPLQGPFAHAYQFGDPAALGYDDGPKNHPRAYDGENNFRLFILAE